MNTKTKEICVFARFFFKWKMQTKNCWRLQFVASLFPGEEDVVFRT